MPITINLKRFKVILPYVFWVLIAAVSYLLLMEHSGTMPGFPHTDKIIHTMLFAMLTTIGYLAYSAYPVGLYGGLMVYGIITEYLQGVLTITRHASLYDWVADVTGILFCTLVIKAIKSFSATKTTHVT